MFKKPQKYDAESGLSEYDLMDDREKRQKRQELFESLIKRLNLLFELDLPDKQLVEKRFQLLDNENNKAENSDDELVAVFDNISPIEQEFFIYLQ